MTRKPELLRIRCSNKTLLDFKRFAVPFDDYEKALRRLMKQYSEIEDEELDDWLDEKVEEGSFRSKSDAIERGLRYLKSKEPEPF